MDRSCPGEEQWTHLKKDAEVKKMTGVYRAGLNGGWPFAVANPKVGIWKENKYKINILLLHHATHLIQMALIVSFMWSLIDFPNLEHWNREVSAT